MEAEAERGIKITHVRVSDYARNQAALQELSDLVAAGKVSLRVAETVRPSRRVRRRRSSPRAATAGRRWLGGAVTTCGQPIGCARRPAPQDSIGLATCSRRGRLRGRRYSSMP
jgi:hypothetical protein